MTELVPAWVNGTLTPVDKLQAHLLGLRHPAVSVFVMDGRRTLLQRRALSKYHTPGLWTNTCCTHPRWDEPPLACATRRLAEELGITGLTLHPAGQIEYRADVGGGLTEHELVDVFVAEAGPALAMTLNPAEVDAVRWVDLDDLADEVASGAGAFTPWLRIYLEQGVGPLARTISSKKS